MIAMWTISEHDYFSPEPEYALEIDRDIQRYRNRAKNQPQIS